MKDLSFISGDFFDREIPKEETWLLNYYKTPIQIQFLRYYLEFGNIDLFQDHTGIVIAPKYLERMRKKYHRLHEARNQAKSNFDMELLWSIEMGKHKI